MPLRNFKLRRKSLAASFAPRSSFCRARSRNLMTRQWFEEKLHMYVSQGCQPLETLCFENILTPTKQG